MSEKVIDVFRRLRNQLILQERDCNNVDSWVRPRLEAGFNLPRFASSEHKALQDLSRTPWLRLVVDNMVQTMYVDNIVGDEGRIPELWEIWQRNDMRSQQISNHRAMITYGHSYGLVNYARPEVGLDDGVKIRFLSPRRLAVEYDDEFSIVEYPSAALELLGGSRTQKRYRLYLPGRVIYVDEVLDGDEEDVSFTKTVFTDFEYVPIVRFANQLDLDGRVIGEVEPFIPSAQRINKTAYDRLLAQHFNSWKVKTITGIDLPEQIGEDGEPTGAVDTQAAERMKIRLAQDDILISEDPETRFGVLDGTSLDPFVHSWRADIEALAAVSQTPTHSLTGQMVNLSAEALAAARAPLMQKVYERQMNAGASYSRLLRTAASMMDLDDVADDPLVRVTWQDMEIRSMSQALDALGKAATMLKIPARGLWGLVPGVELADVQEWERLAEEDWERDPLMSSLQRQAESTIEDVSGG